MLSVQHVNADVNNKLLFFSSKIDYIIIKFCPCGGIIMHRMSLIEARHALKNKQMSSEELTRHYLDRVEHYKEWNAYITLCPEMAIKRAKSADARIASGTSGVMEGIPLAIKDLFVTKGIRTTAGSKMLCNFIPPYESTVSQKLLDAGAVFLGKTNMDEFAMGSANLTSYYGRVVNPWSVDRELCPGGSSGGSAAAVAGHLCVAATGSDTGGSIRQPAAFCGIVGLKPTYGRCSRYGMVAFSSSLDQAGPMTKTVADSAALLSVIAGYDEKDSTSKNIPVEDYESYVGRSVNGLKVGILEDSELLGCSEGMLQHLHKSAEWLKDGGAEIVRISLPYYKAAISAYYVIAPAEASSNLSRYDGVRFGYRSDNADTLEEMYENTRSEGFGSEVKRRILMGTYVLSAGYFDAYYTKAKLVQKAITNDFTRVFKDVDVILMPTTTDSAFPLDEAPTDPTAMYLNDVFTVTVNIAGLPALSVPCGLDGQNRPLGVQLIAPHFKEGALITCGCVIEKSSNFKPWGRE